MAQNANLLRLPLKDGTLGVMFTRKDTIHYPFIFIGNICELVKGYNNSTFYIGVGQALIKPCSGSDEEAIEISSQGLEFIYHTGIGLEYISGNGTIKMLGKSYELSSEKQPMATAENSDVTLKQYQPVLEHNQPAANSANYNGTIDCIIVGLEGGNKCRIKLKEYLDKSFYLSLEDAIIFGLIIKTENVLNTSAAVGKKVVFNVSDSWIKAVDGFKIKEGTKPKVQDTYGISKEKTVGEKINPGLSMEDVISLLSMGNVVNRDLAGGLYIGMGVFPKNQNEKSSYTGNAALDGYDIVFENGKVISAKVVNERLGSKKANFSYTIK